MTAANWKQGLATMLLLLSSTASMTACHKQDAGLPLGVEISQQFVAEPLQLQKLYSLADGQQLKVDRLRYYLSNFRLHGSDGQWTSAARSDTDARGYYLVDAADPASQKFVLDGLKAGRYDAIEFLVGVDTARNHQGAQTGALDPVHGMFWTWNTGYIFFKLEGQSPQSKASGESVTYHIGGTQPTSLARTIYLPLGEKPLRLEKGLSGTVHLHFDLAALFAASPPLSLAEHNNIMDPKDGVVIADRYATAFRVDHLHQEPLH